MVISDIGKIVKAKTLEGEEVSGILLGFKKSENRATIYSLGEKIKVVLNTIEYGYEKPTCFNKKIDLRLSDKQTFGK